MKNPNLPSLPEIKFFVFRSSPAASLTIIYLFLSIFWILGSDRMAATLSGGDRILLENIQAVKGLFFVFITSAVLFILSRKFYNDLKTSFLQQEVIQTKYYAVNEITREGVFDYNLVNKKGRINNKMKFFFPANSQEVDDFWEKYLKRIHPKDFNRLSQEFELIARSGKPTSLLEYQLLGRDNKYYTVISHVYIIRDPNTGEAMQLIGVVHDVTELRNLQAENYEQKLSHKQRLTESIIQAQENERERWAGELHDNVCQILGVANLYLSSIDLKNPSSAELLPAAGNMVTQALEEIRQLSSSIKPPSFEKMTLSESVECLVANVNRVKPILFCFDSSRLPEQEVTDEKKLLIYRIIQEQLNNIVKYAAAEKVDITLSVDKWNYIQVLIRDNGKGFNPRAVKAGIGLHNMESRVQAHKGTVEIQSSPGSGCTLLASFSL